MPENPFSRSFFVNYVSNTSKNFMPKSVHSTFWPNIAVNSKYENLYLITVVICNIVYCSKSPPTRVLRPAQWLDLPSIATTGLFPPSPRLDLFPCRHNWTCSPVATSGLVPPSARVDLFFLRHAWTYSWVATPLSRLCGAGAHCALKWNWSIAGCNRLFGCPQKVLIDYNIILLCIICFCYKLI